MAKYFPEKVSTTLRAEQLKRGRQPMWIDKFGGALLKARYEM
jgi:hypothetical protein